MGTESPVCLPWVTREFRTKIGTDVDGNPVYKIKVVDTIENSVGSATVMCGDHWCQRHADTLKHVLRTRLRNLCEWTGLSHAWKS